MKIRQDLFIEIDGGLGNQLFMFYAGLFLAEKLDKNIVFNLSRLKKVNKKPMPHTISSLGMLNNFETFSGKKLLMTPSQKYHIKRKVYEKFNCEVNDLTTRTFFESDEIGYIPDSKVPRETQFIKGYFQTWKYFESLKKKPILDYSKLEKPTQWLDFSLAEIKQADPFVLHVRRGDYREPKNQSIGCLSVEYFEEVIKKFGGDQEIWVFSDSIEKVQVEFEGISRKVKFIKPPRESDPVESLILMSNASRIAISNSTFSWWAAKFGDQRSTIITPEQWFKNRSDPLDLLPESWIKVRSHWLK
jgi:hypothetical protein